ncbi:MAG: DUF2179 domain-containing protein [Gemmatimonadetes bacterium]|nr:DUF2179 domain-containing protein [Gemmatimonadota bacterium]MDA1103475.1 DUF2179 domain-containing protein [Gemmatimonadota bacterium]
MLQELVAGPFGPLLVFVLRATDVTMATMRMLLIVRNHRIIAPIIGFFEILVWVAAIGIVVQHLNSPLHIIGYAAGFACGNYLGLLLEERLALGLATIRTVVRSGGPELAAELRDGGFGVTEMAGQGREGTVEVLYSVIPRRNVDRCLAIIDRGAPDSFVVVDEPRLIRRGWLYQKRKK